MALLQPNAVTLRIQGMNRNRLSTLSLLVCAWLLVGCRGQLVGRDGPITTTELTGSIATERQLVDALVDVTAATSNSAEFGIVVGLIDGDTQTTFVVGNPAFDEGTLFEYGSITKVLTGNLLAQLEDEGTMALDMPLNDVLPVAMQADKWETVTVTDLLTHSAGLPRMPRNYTSPGRILSGGNPVSYDEQDLIAAMAAVELEGAGESRAYSNFGFGILGAVVEEQAGGTYADVVQTRLFDPLNMETATIHGWGGDDIAPALRGNDIAGGNWDFDVMASAGALRGSILDGLAFLDGSMTACQQTDPVSVANCTTITDFSTLNSRTMGLAWQVSDDGVIWHNGGTGGYRAMLGFHLPENRGIVMLANSGVTEGLEEIAFDWLTANR